MKILVFALLILGVLGCARHEPVTDDDRYREIQTQIDHKEYDRAEATLKDILDHDPQNQRARVILASMYVHRAGITLKDYFGLEKLSHLEAKSSQAPIDLQKIEKSKVAKDSEFQKAVEFMEQINTISEQARDISEKFNQIPVVNDQQALDLYQAWQELEKIENPEPGNALYRGVVKLFYFKYLWASGKILRFGDQKFCSLQVSNLSQHLEEVGAYLVGLIQDAALGFPKSGASFQKQIADLDRNFKAAREKLEALNKSNQTVKEVTEKLAKDQSIEAFQCDF